MTHLQLDRLAVGYKGKALIRGIEIGVERGEIVTLVGPNGSGKSTILKTITRQLVPVGGDIFLAEGEMKTPSGGNKPSRSGVHSRVIDRNGSGAGSAKGDSSRSSAGSVKGDSSRSGTGSVKGDSSRSGTGSAMKSLDRYAPSELARQMAVMLTGRLQTELMTCRDVTAMGRYPYTGRLGILSEADERKVEEALAAVHAEHLADRPFDAVSDGERQRILLSRAICQEPAIIVLDEPTSYLDIRHKLELLDILHKMSRDQGITVLMSLHEIDLAMKISDRVICVKGEEIFASGKPSEILNDETVRRLYDLDPELGRFDARTGSLELYFAESSFRSGEAAGAAREGEPQAEAGTGSGVTLQAEAGSGSGVTLHAAAGTGSGVTLQAEAGTDTGRELSASGEIIPADTHGDGAVKVSFAESDTCPQEALALPRVMLAAPGSGSGKTVITCGLLRLLQRKSLRPAAFKCGPDYIDPMFHRQVLGVPSRNLDTFFSPADSPAPGNTVNEIMARAARRSQADLAVIEGVMGYFDGTGASGMEASSWDLASRTDTPVILVVNARGMSRSIVPLLKGFAEYEGEERRIGGVILNRVTAGMFPVMKRWIETDTALKVIGYVPQDDFISWGSRHLGLLMPEELADLQGRVDHLADILEKTIDLDALMALAESAPALRAAPGRTGGAAKARTAPGRTGDAGPTSVMQPLPGRTGGAAKARTAPGRTGDAGPTSVLQPLPGRTDDGPNAPAALPEETLGRAARLPAPRIAVALDEAFNFYYEDNLDLLRECGADLVFFSPIRDRELPDADGLLIGGGYPELHARALAENETMKASIRQRAAAGLPILAECGGFMYLQETLVLPGQGAAAKETAWLSGDLAAQNAVAEDADRLNGHLPGQSAASEEAFPMCGVLPGTCRKTDRLVRFGYIELEKKGGAAGEAGCLQDGHRIRGHEFHYFDSTDNGAACTAQKPGRKRSWDCMAVRGNIMAGFPHLYYRSDPAFAETFVEKCRHFSISEK